MASILCVSLNDGLLATRKLILEAAGHVVVTAREQAGLVAACRQNRFDAAVFTQTGVPESSRLWVSLMREHCPGIRVLEVFTPNVDTPLAEADDWLESLAVASELVVTVEALLAQKRQTPPSEVAD